MKAGSFIRSIQVRPARLKHGPGRAGTETAANLPEGTSRSALLYYGDLDYDRLLRNQIAQNGLPNDAGVLLSLGAIQRRQGKWRSRPRTLRKRRRLIRKTRGSCKTGHQYEALRRYERPKDFDRGIELVPSSMGLHAMKSKLRDRMEGRRKCVFEQELAKVPPGFDPDGMITEARVGFLLYERKSRRRSTFQNLKGDVLHGENGVPTPSDARRSLLFTSGRQI